MLYCVVVEETVVSRYEVEVESPTVEQAVIDAKERVRDGDCDTFNDDAEVSRERVAISATVVVL